MREHRSIELTMANGDKVRGDYRFTVEDGLNPATTTVSTPVVVFAHGLGSTRTGEKVTAFEAECARRGWGLMAADFRGHGESDGKMVELSGARLLEDLSAIVAEARGLAGGPLLLVGSSMGGWATAWLATSSPAPLAQIDACVLIAPALRFFDWIEMDDEARRQWERTGRHRLRSGYIDLELGYQLCADAPLYPYDELLTRFTRPAIIFHGMRDETIPYKLSLDFVERCVATRLELCLSREGDHRLLPYKDRMARESCEFFAGICRESSQLSEPDDRLSEAGSEK